MILRRLSMVGVTRYENQIDVDFSSIGPGLIAVLGPNGAGKTTLLECTGPAALYRELPTRDQTSLVESVGPNGGKLVLEFDYCGDTYNITHKILPSKTQSAFLSINGKPVTSGKLKDFDAAITSRFGTARSFYATVFAAQGGGGRFASLSVPDRKALFRFYLGLDRVDAIHQAAKKRAGSLDLARIERLEAQHKALSDRIPELRATLKGAQAATVAAGDAKKAAREALEALSREESLLPMVEAYEQALKEVLAAKGALPALEARAAAIVIPDGPSVDAAFEEMNAARALEAEKSAAKKAEWEARSTRETRATVLNTSVHRSEILETVPCKAIGECSGCFFLTEAHKAASDIPELKARLIEAANAHNEASLYLEEIQEKCSKASAEAENRYRVAKFIETKKAELAAAQRAVETARANIAALAKKAVGLRRLLPDPLPVIDPERLRTARDAAAKADAAFEAAVRIEAATINELTNTQARATALASELDIEREARKDDIALSLLTRGFGPSGIQALEIEAAGPRVSDIANALLDACYGDRFSIEVKTLRDLKSRAGVAEDFSVNVIDRDRGRSGSLASLSGGEQVIVDEALRTALSLFAVESSSSVQMKTLWRDETPAALYGENVNKYTAMLAKARLIGGLHHVIFIGGDAVADVADTVLEVTAEGTVVVRR